jgi:asparagine synthase (glutamine-hydrolysing)
MCGICGIFGRGDQATVAAMLDTLIHRGPDDGYFVVKPDFALGARRLSIVDVQAGRQPLSNEDRTIWAAQNGELYNYPAVSPQILARGHQLSTHCDTEMLPHLYEDYGTQLPEHIDGMFAVAVWDDVRKVGILARDRMGKKPLYYHARDDILYFASEIKALLRIPGFERQINLQALNHYLSFKHVPHPLSIFEGISILPPAHLLHFTPGGSLQVRRYWDVDFSGADADLPEEDIVEEVLRLLRRGVERRLMSDVPIGFFLSGGIDSSLSTVLAAELCPNRIQTFTLTYADGSSSEGKELDRRWASFVARKYDTEHYEATIEFAHFPDSIRDILIHFDEPFAGVVSTYFLSQLIAKHVKVALAGDGADELFGSYLSHRLAMPLANYGEYQRTGQSTLIRPFEEQTDLLHRLAESEDWAWRNKLLVYSDDEKAALFEPSVSRTLEPYSTSKLLRQSFATLTATDPLNRILEMEFRTFFPDQVLTFVDRLSMAHSLEVRSAYLDTDLVAFVASLPGHLKMKGGETKYLLKQAALKYFPSEMVFRKKEGFLMPIAQWLLNDLQDYVRETLSPQRLQQHNLFNVACIQSLVDGLYQGQKDYTYANKILVLLIFQEWYDLYMRAG